MLHEKENLEFDAEAIAGVLEHSITGEDEIWRADPFDVASVHADARKRYEDLLAQGGSGRRVASRIILYHGQSGAGKTHLMRALRTYTHRNELGYFGYAQVATDVSNYSEYFLGRLINGLEKPYDPVAPSGENGLQRLSRLLVQEAGLLDEATLDDLRNGQFSAADLACLVSNIADAVVMAPAFAESQLDLNVVRALLYLQRCDPRINRSVRQYFSGRRINEFNLEMVSALEQIEGDDRALEIIGSLGNVMAALDGSSLVLCIDQVEDLKLYDDHAERFQRAIRDLIQITSRVPTAIILISSLGAFYDLVRDRLPDSYRDRIEQAAPVALHPERTAAEARAIVGARLANVGVHEDGIGWDAEDVFGLEFFDDLAGLSTRKLLEETARQWRIEMGEEVESVVAAVPMGSPPEAALNELSSFDRQVSEVSLAPSPGAGAFSSAGDFQVLWNDHLQNFATEEMADDVIVRDILMEGARLAGVEVGGDVEVTTAALDEIDGVGAFDLGVSRNGGPAMMSRVYVCNRSAQGGAMKRQLERVLETADGSYPIIIRTSEFPAKPKGATGVALRQFQTIGGQKLVVQVFELERIAALRAFEGQMRQNGGFTDWLRDARLMCDLEIIAKLVRLQTMTREPMVVEQAPEPPAVGEALFVLDGTLTDCTSDDDGSTAPTSDTGIDLTGGCSVVPQISEGAGDLGFGADEWEAEAESDRGWSGDYTSGPWSVEPAPVNPRPLLIGVPVDGQEGATVDLIAKPLADNDSAANDTAEPEQEPEAGAGAPQSDTLGNNSGQFPIGNAIGDPGQTISLGKNILKRHAAMLGGSGSGKTTLALSVIEQLLLSGVPVVLIDRKGDLCSYANPDVWRPIEGEDEVRFTQREELGSMIDVAVYTPGRTTGRPIGITLLPNGISELPEHEQQELANVSATAIGQMLHLGNSASHQRQGGVLAVALKILGMRARAEVTLSQLIQMLEDDDEELIELSQRMDPSGKLRRDLIAQMDSLRHRNWALFEGGGEPLSMESMLGLGRFARAGRTRLSVVYTGFLGDNENILFWVSQFLSEALRFCQRNPNDELQAIVMFDEADLYIPANSRPATSEPLQSLLKRARSAGVGIILATQSPGDLDYKSRDQITSWFIGRVREDTALRKLRAAFGAESGLDPARVLPNQTVGEFHLIQEAEVCAMKSRMSLIQADQVPFDRIEQLARETRGQDAKQLALDLK